MNAAEYLLEFFNEETRADGVEFDLRRVMCAISEVGRQLDGMESMGVSRFGRYRAAMPELWEQAWYSFRSANGAFSFTPADERRVSPGVTFMLLDIRDNGLSIDVTLDDGRRRSVDDMLAKVIETVNEDDTLSMSLKAYVVKLVHEVRLAMDLSRAGCDFELSDALARLMDGIGKAESVSGKRSVWEKLREDAIVPFTSAFFSALGAAVGAYAIGAASGQYRLP
ncbi:hypothetical protein DSM100688_0424 [Bifidobacterium ramosum]|nr:hypothetical protein DSM100688_0424 [Bifidobacterium ramosum]